MVKVVSKEDCGNSPKRLYLYDFCVAVAKAEIDTVMDMVTDDIQLHVHGGVQVSGREAVQEMLIQDSNQSPVVELELDSIITHGNVGSANGVMKFEDNGLVEFCNVYKFNNFSKNAKISAIDAYSIVVNGK